jgi:cystathionine beta-lyase/cystathionine gamma-synthase
MSRPDLGPTAPLVPPIYPSAVYALPDLDALDAVSDGTQPGYIYSRDAHPNADILAAELTALEGGTWGVVCGSGMAALSAAFVGLLAAGDTVLASDQLYGRTSQLLKSQLARFGVATVSVDVSDLDATRTTAAAHRPKLVYVETMSNPLCRVPDVPAIAEITHGIGARLVVDNTFASPVLCRPLALGADVVMESLTKMIGGHSDVTLGFLAGADAALLAPVRLAVSVWGFGPSPSACWQAARGLETLPLRMAAAASNAVAVADWLAVQPGVARVVYPGRADHPDHALAHRQFPDGCGNMLCFDLAGGRHAVNHFMRAAPGVPFCPSLGHVRSTVSYPAGTSHRYDSPAEQARQGITPGLVRLSVGCEPLAALQGELAKGLAAVQCPA